VGELDDTESPGRVEVHKWVIASVGGEVQRLAMTVRQEKDGKVLARDRGGDLQLYVHGAAGRRQDHRRD
jgi:hypothetical protein